MDDRNGWVALLPFVGIICWIAIAFRAIFHIPPAFNAIIDAVTVRNFWRHVLSENTRAMGEPGGEKKLIIRAAISTTVWGSYTTLGTCFAFDGGCALQQMF